MISRTESRTVSPVGATFLMLAPVTGPISHVYLKIHITFLFLMLAHNLAYSLHIPAVPFCVLGPQSHPTSLIDGVGHHQEVLCKMPVL